jgi:ferrous iron transport protein A
VYLHLLRKGEIARIISLDDSAFREKLLDMGCIPGALISLRFKAPLGDPFAFDLEGYTLSMRKAEAKTVMVQKFEND